MNVMIKSGDVFLTRGNAFISKAIRFFTRGIGEKRTKVNHVGVVVEDGDLENAVVVEALSKVVQHKLWSQYGLQKKTAVAVYRANNLTADEIEIIVKTAKKQVGKKYGWLMIGAHFMDWFLLGAYVFRRFVPGDRYPICSWLVAHSFSEADKHFGVDPGAATPDDIWDFITEKHPELYQEIHPLKPLS